MDCEHPTSNLAGFAARLEGGALLTSFRLTTSGEYNSDFSNQLGRRTYSAQFSVQHLSISTNPSTTFQLHEISGHQISRLQVRPLTVPILEALQHQILLQCIDLFLHHQVAHFEIQSTLSSASSIRPHWMEAHASHLAGLSQS